MHIVEGVNKKYCYAKECIWDNEKKVYQNPGKCIGKLEGIGKQKEFVPNKYLIQLLSQYKSDSSSLSTHEMLIVTTVIEKYGKEIIEKVINPPSTEDALTKTARAVFYGPQLVFGDITKRYKLQSFLEEAFSKETALDILSLAWYIASEGNTISNSDSWLEYFENPRGGPMKDITHLLDRITIDDMMDFYKLWFASQAGDQDDDRILYGLTSISYHANSIDDAEWEHNRDKEKLRQMNFALMCKRRTGIPLLAWTMNGEISDVSALENTLQFVNKLGYKPSCLMLDRAFSSMEKITYMLRHGYTFLQALKINANWIRELIDAGENERMCPDSMRKVEDRMYYVSTVKCKLIVMKHLSGKKAGSEETIINMYRDGKWEMDTSSNEDVQVISQHTCYFHALFCQDLVGNQRDLFMGALKEEYERLATDETAEVKKELAKYFIISKPKYAKRRTVEYNLEAIKQQENKYAGFVCFLTNDKAIKTAADALSEHSMRDYIEKDFDGMKNDLDMQRLKLHADHRMKARLFIQFIAEMYMRELRVKLHEYEECRKMTRKQISSHIKTIYKIKFMGKHRDVQPSLSKSQKDILAALGINTS